MHSLSRRDGTPWTQKGLSPDDIPQVNRPCLAYLGTMSAVGLLSMPRTGAQQAAHIILGQPPRKNPHSGVSAIHSHRYQTQQRTLDGCTSHRDLVAILGQRLCVGDCEGSGLAGYSSGQDGPTQKLFDV